MVYVVSPPAAGNTAFLLVYKPFCTEGVFRLRRKRSIIWCIWKPPLERRRLIGLVFEGDPPTTTTTSLKLCRISSRDMSEAITLAPSSLDSPAGQQTLTAQEHSQQQQHLLILHCPPWLTVVFCFSQAKYWNPCVNEVEGVITDNKGNVIHKLFGKWHEAVYCGEPPSATCVWRASTTSFFMNASITSLNGVLRGFSFLSVCHADVMPVDHEQYYGFTKFAVELNELDPSLKPLLPPTDTRLRLDQR